MSNYSSQLEIEQRAVDRAYNRLDDLRAQARQRLDAVRAAGSHGSPTQRTERDSFATMYEDRLTQLRSVEDRLVFGRLDNTSGDRRYIGRIGLSDEHHEPILTDWRAEAARPFYEATPSNHGDIVMRRHITLHFREVTGVEDEVLDVHSAHVDEASQSGTLTGEGALLASLSSRRTGKMTDIVATIQAEQDAIIRADLKGAVVVQGGPGTGKTAVALHRAAYLLYTHRRMLDRSGVLVIGPSSTFLRYIDQVLPSLGETGVVSRTIADLIPGVTATRVDEPYAAKIKGQARMHEAIRNAVAGRERVPQQLPVISINGIRIAMRAEDIREAIRDARRTRQPHNKARETFVREMLETMRRRYVDELDYAPEAEELRDIMSQLRMNDQLRITLNLAWLPMNAQWLLDQLFSKPEQLHRYAPWLNKQQVQALVRPKGSELTVSDIPLLDEALELLGPDPREAARAAARDAARQRDEQFAQETLAQAGIGSGIVSSSMLVDQMQGLDAELTAQRAAADREWTYGHIVVDEAQELTAMDWRMLIRRCPSRSFTIVGDVAQTSALGGTRDWARTMDRLFGPENWSLNELTINYRNPKEVSQLAAEFAEREGLYVSTVNGVRTMPDSVKHEVCDDQQALLKATGQQAAQLASEFVQADGTGRVAVITPIALHDEVQASVKQALRSAMTDSQMQQLEQGDAWDHQVSVVGAQDVKGLEYDAVIVVDPGMIEQEAPSRLVAASDLYVALTRPTQRLVILRTRADEKTITV
ncbi:ATP-dependent DNA helicase [Bifidobacterium dolichotidis]|uniref:ATP-dependent DNA helicase n=1 Tax=Bifidobacterium dolichotidis TaxID=2306976 RepID=A0A430FS41_9BIFI|nr:AAA family ATPase [Bifidobacterium dolichotidis]RSX55691.1 ATP-dependent DNA helicase [Bifidobacterium dolichotidis]